MDITAENLEGIILQFYQSDASSQIPAHEWLTVAQQSPNAWCFVWELLSPEKSPEVQFFAATTLHTKVAKHLSEVPEDQYVTFKNKLIDTLKNYRNGPKIIVNRLCIAMAAFILQVSPERWEDPVCTLRNTLCPDSSPAASDEALRCLLVELLMVLPEEFQTMHIPQGRRGLVRNELQKSFPQVSSMLVWALKWGSEREVEIAVCCARAWMQLGVPLPEAVGEGLVAPGLIQLACHMPWSSVTSAALEALGELATHPDTHHHPCSILALVTSLVPAVGELARRWTVAGDQEAACAAFSLITAIGESHIRLLLGEAKDGVANPCEVLLLILELLLECTGMHGQYPIDETLSSIPFGFWYILQEEVVSLEAAQHAAYVHLLSPVYSRLTDILLLKSVLPDGRERQQRPLTQEEAESFRCYRTDIADTMTYCHGILHESLSEQLLLRLNEQLEVHRENPSLWQPLEACLHSLLSIAESARGEPLADANISQFLTAVGSLPLSSNSRLLATALEVVGAHAEWLNDNPGAVGSVLPLLVQGLSNVQTAPSATMALKDLSRDCSAGLLPYAHHILIASQETIGRGTLRPAEIVRLTYVVGRVLSSLAVSEAAPYLDNLLTLCLNHIRLLNSDQPSASSKASMMVRLKMIAAVISAMGMQSKDTGSSHWAPVMLPLLQQIIPILEEVTSHWYNDEATMQAVCLVLKHAATTLLDDIVPALPSILRLLVTSYLLHQHSVLLDLSRHLIIMFWSTKTSEGAPVVGNLLKEMCQATLCLPNNLNPISSERVDILEAFFGLLSQVVRRNPRALASLRGPIDASMLLHASTRALSLPEAPVIKSVSSFLSNFVMHGSEVKEICSAIDNHGEALVQQLLLCIGGGSPRTLTDHISDVMLALSKKCFESLCHWMNGLLLGPQAKDFPSQRVTRQQKELFVQVVLRERCNKRCLQEAVREFSLLCRGLSMAQPNGGVPVTGLSRAC